MSETCAFIQLGLFFMWRMFGTTTQHALRSILSRIPPQADLKLSSSVHWRDPVRVFGGRPRKVGRSRFLARDAARSVAARSVGCTKMVLCLMQRRQRQRQSPLLPVVAAIQVATQSQGTWLGADGVVVVAVQATPQPWIHFRTFWN